MTYPRINTTQLQHILSGKVQIETFSTLKDYSKSIFVSHNNSIYYSLVDISAGPFKPSQWQKVILLSDFDTKQDKITSTGTTNLLTAPEYVGGQPGKIAISSLEPAFNILPKSKGGAGKDLSDILKSANADNILVIDSNGNIINVKTLDRSQLSQEINELLDSADTAIQPSELNEVKVSLDNHKKDESNPHKVTKEQVGLGNVDNTSDIDKPISKATQDALDLKADADAYVKKSGDTMTDTLYFQSTGQYSRGIKFGSKTQLATDAFAPGIKWNKNNTLEIGDSCLLYNTAYHVLLPDYDNSRNLGDSKTRWKTIYTYNLNNGEDLAVPTSGGTLARIEDIPEIPVQSVNNKTGDVVLTSDDINATIGEVSYTLQETLDLKANQSDVYTKLEANNLLDKKLDIDTASDTYATIDDFENHTSDTSNPHKVTKAQVGLGNVDNTSDINKPISTATQNALDLKQDNLTAGERIIINNNIIETTATRIIVRKW